MQVDQPRREPEGEDSQADRDPTLARIYGPTEHPQKYTTRVTRTTRSRVLAAVVAQARQHRRAGLAAIKWAAEREVYNAEGMARTESPLMTAGASVRLAYGIAAMFAPRFIAGRYAAAEPDSVMTYAALVVSTEPP